MASKNTQNTVDGDTLIVEELMKQLKRPVPERKMLQYWVEHGVIAVESLLEFAISRIGKISRSNENGEDFNDGTDAKKGTVTLNDKATGARSCTIGNVHNKNGTLRIMVAEPMDGKCYYFLVPKHECTGKLTIKISFSKNGGPPDHLHKTMQQLLESNERVDYDALDFSTRAWIKYRVHSFQELASAESV